MNELRPLDNLVFQTRPIPSRDIGQVGELRWIKLSQLYVDPAYQRDILDAGKANIRRIIEGFSWLLFGTLVVGTRGNDRYAIIDGQHRAMGAKMHGGIEAVPCLVLTGTRQDEARAFSSINGNTTRIHALQSFRAKVAAGDAEALRLTEIVARADVRFVGYPKQNLDAGETMCLGAIALSLKRHGQKIVVAALTLLRSSDPDAGLSAPPIYGACDVLTKHPQWVDDAHGLGAKLAARGGAVQLIAKAAARKVTRGGPLWINYSAVLADAIAMAERAGSLPLSRLMAGR